MFIDQILAQNPIFVAWFWWLVFINSLSMGFVIWSREARWILAVWLINIWGLELFYNIWGLRLLDGVIGYSRLLNLTHIALWTPLLAYLILRAPHIAWRSVTGRYIGLLMFSNAIALILDYRAFILWLLGERAAQL